MSADITEDDLALPLTECADCKTEVWVDESGRLCDDEHGEDTHICSWDAADAGPTDDGAVAP